MVTGIDRFSFGQVVTGIDRFSFSQVLTGIDRFSFGQVVTGIDRFSFGTMVRGIDRWFLPLVLENPVVSLPRSHSLVDWGDHQFSRLPDV